jgi:ABC-type bacteriocin/lantibiotic exporter with double-glycine peptidase domain
MNLQEVWKKLELEKLEVSKPSPINPWAAKSKHPVEKLKNAYRITTFFCISFLAVFILLLFLFDEPIVRIGIVLMIVFYVIFSIVNFSMYRKINTSFPIDQDLKGVLTNTYLFIKNNIRFQERFALFVYPFAASAGYLLGLSASSGNAQALMNERFVVSMMIVTAIVITPIAWLLARWLYRKSYGTCLGELKKLIEELEKPD